MHILIKNHCLRSIFLIICLLLKTSTMAIAQEKMCDYDKANPTLKKAQAFYKANDHECAKQALYDFLKLDTLSSSEIAEAHIWIGMAHFRLLKDKPEQYDSVFSHFFTALENYPGYRGTLSKDSTSDIGLILKQAKDSLSRIEDWRERRTQDSLKTLCLQYNSDMKRLWIYRIATGVGFAGAVIGGLIFNAGANESYDRYLSAIDPDDIRSEWQSYEEMHRGRNVMIGAAAILAIVEAYWFIKKPEKPQINCTSILASRNIGRIGPANNAIGIEVSVYIPGL